MKITLDWGDGFVREYHTQTEPEPTRDVVVIKTIHPRAAEVCEIEFERGINKLVNNQIVKR